MKMKMRCNEKLKEKLLYRKPMLVKECIICGNNYLFPLCPRCNTSIERDYQAFCNGCGQKLFWRGNLELLKVRN